MARQWCYIKTQIPNSDSDYTQSIGRGFEFVQKEDGRNTIVSKLSITAETNLKLLVEYPEKVMEVYLKQGTTWNIGNEDNYNLMSIKCDNDNAKVTYMIGYSVRGW